MRISLVSFADHSFTVKAPNLKWSSCTVRPASVALPVIMFQELEIFTGFTFDETKMHPKLYRNKATPPRAATCMPRTHSGNMATYVPLPQGVGQNVVFGTCLGRENLIRVPRLFITTSKRGSGGPFQIRKLKEVLLHADEMRWMDCRGFEVSVHR